MIAAEENIPVSQIKIWKNDFLYEQELKTYQRSSVYKSFLKTNWKDESDLKDYNSLAIDYSGYDIVQTDWPIDPLTGMEGKKKEVFC